jgi:hypothetical protein
MAALSSLDGFFAMTFSFRAVFFSVLLLVDFLCARFAIIPSLLPRHRYLRERLHLLFGVLNHLAGHVHRHFVNSAGELERRLV